MKRPKANLCVVLCFLVGNCDATSIVAIRVPGLIVVGMDSAGTFEGRGSSPQIKPVCKVYQNGDMFFAVAGFVNDPVTHFNIASVVSAASKKRGSIRVRAEVALLAVRGRVPKELATLKRVDPDMYAKIVSEERDFVTILFFGLEKGDVVATGWGLKVLLSKKGTIGTVPNWRSCPGVDCPNGTYIFLLGEHGAIDQHFAAGKPIPSVLADAATFLVQLEITEKPADVQPPIDVLRLDSNGAVWICRKQECPDVRRRSR